MLLDFSLKVGGKVMLFKGILFNNIDPNQHDCLWSSGFPETYIL